jgi:hypothetical protein
MKKIRAQMRSDGLTKDSEKIAALEDYLVENSPAEKWYNNTLNGAGAPTTWAQLEKLFVDRFPTPEKAERTPQEYERELLAMKLTVEELDTTVNVSGAEVYTHIRFAGRLLELAKLAGIAATAAGIWQARDALPDVIREKVSAKQTDWTTFTNAIKGIDRVDIREGAAKAKKAQEMERTLRDLAAKDKRQAPMTPASKVASQLAQVALATPRANSTPPPANPFGAGGGRGNLFGQTQTPNQNEPMTPEALTKLKGIVERLSRALLRDDAAGRAEYTRRITIWENAYAGSRPHLEDVGYPLSPGTVAPGSGECFACGKITTPMHRSNECTGPKLPRRESTFRSIVNKHMRTTPVQVNAVVDWMDFGEAEEEDFLAGLPE